ncbi:hypothetical protein Y032_0014g2357 [Ancylostoma ceylanicum]|uniref:Uncharacterized protein n=1 Tax=Ancylostoma ceylanicum TaxID=53326 RepID=A0A016VAW3_9BILA|nr:hypothetical protein Y032_0014g2357 [Ancylostoma ceylanicum]
MSRTEKKNEKKEKQNKTESCEAGRESRRLPFLSRHAWQFFSWLARVSEAGEGGTYTTKSSRMLWVVNRLSVKLSKFKAGPGSKYYRIERCN